MPEVLYALRLALARVLREAAQDEAPAVAVRLREIADRFEIGQEGTGQDELPGGTDGHEGRD